MWNKCQFRNRQNVKLETTCCFYTKHIEHKHARKLPAASKNYSFSKSPKIHISDKNCRFGPTTVKGPIFKFISPRCVHWYPYYGGSINFDKFPKKDNHLQNVIFLLRNRLGSKYSILGSKDKHFIFSKFPSSPRVHW